MQRRVQDSDDDGQRHGSNLQPVSARESKRGEQQEQDDSGDELSKPAAKSEGRNGQKRQPGADGTNAGIVRGEKIVLRFIGDVHRERQREDEPGDSEGMIHH